MLAAPSFWPELARELDEYRDPIIVKLRRLLGPERFARLEGYDRAFFDPASMVEVINRPGEDSPDPGGLGIQLMVDDEYLQITRLAQATLNVQLFPRFSHAGRESESEKLRLSEGDGYPEYMHSFSPTLAHYLRIYLLFAMEVLQPRPIATAITLITMLAHPFVGSVKPEKVDVLLRTHYASCRDETKRLVAHLMFLSFNLDYLRRQLLVKALDRLVTSLGFRSARFVAPKAGVPGLYLETIDETLPLLDHLAYEKVAEADLMAVSFDGYHLGLLPALTDLQHIFLMAYENTTLELEPYQASLVRSIQC